MSRAPTPMTSPRNWRVIALLAWLVFGVAVARTAAAPAAAAHTGDPWVDTMLLDIDRYAARYPDAFADELARYHGAPRELVTALLADGGWTPGEVYFACVLGQYAGQPCRRIAAAHDRDRAREWSALAADAGVVPGSDAFHRLKRAIVHSYARWARPLRIDASLHADFPKLPLAPPADRARPADAPARTRKAGA